MSQPSSSIDPFAPPELTAKQMVKFVEEYCAADTPPTPLRRLIELLLDPYSKSKQYRLNPLAVSLGAFVLIGFGAFIYFSFV